MLEIIQFHKLNLLLTVFRHRPLHAFAGTIALVAVLSSCDVNDRASKNAPKPLDDKELVNDTNFLATKLRDHKLQINGLQSQIHEVRRQISESTGLSQRHRQALRALLIEQSQHVEALRLEKEHTESEIARLQDQAAR